MMVSQGTREEIPRQRGDSDTFNFQALGFYIETCFFFGVDFSINEVHSHSVLSVWHFTER